MLKKIHIKTEVDIRQNSVIRIKISFVANYLHKQGVLVPYNTITQKKKI